MIPSIDIAALFDRPSPARDALDGRIRDAASGTGFMLVHGLPADVPMGVEARRELLRLFTLPASDIRKLWRQKFDPARPNVYRGWFALQPGHPTYKEGIDMGPDIAHGSACVDAGDPLREATPLPAENLLPGWRSSIAAYYLAMEHAAAALMRAIARGLGLEEKTFDDFFAGGISTLRLIRYPIRPKDSLAGPAEAETRVEHRGEQRHLVGRAHVDTGFVTLLAQDGVDGLQARGSHGEWIDVPPLEGTLAVNFGNTLERWTGGRIKATQHRVLGSARERFSIPFFYEPRVDAVISPLPLPGIEPFAPFSYGDHLWATTTRFVEFQGLEHLRQPRGVSGPAAGKVPPKQASLGGMRT